jgi:hypothetical protein
MMWVGVGVKSASKVPEKPAKGTRGGWYRRHAHGSNHVNQSGNWRETASKSPKNSEGDSDARDLSQGYSQSHSGSRGRAEVRVRENELGGMPQTQVDAKELEKATRVIAQFWSPLDGPGFATLQRCTRFFCFIFFPIIELGRAVLRFLVFVLRCTLCP